MPLLYPKKDPALKQISTYFFLKVSEFISLNFDTCPAQAHVLLVEIALRISFILVEARKEVRR